MKKQFKTIILIFLVVISIFVLTGCEEKDEETSRSRRKNTIKEEGNLEINDEFDENDDEEKDDEEKDDKNKNAVKEYTILYGLQNGYGLIQKINDPEDENDNYESKGSYVINDKGKILSRVSPTYHFSSSSPATFVNGFVLNSEKSSLIDPNGNLIIDNTNNGKAIRYGNVNDTGEYVFVIREYDELAGITYKTNIETLDGDIIYSVDKDLSKSWKSFEWINGEYAVVEVNTINCKTKEVFEGNKYSYLGNGYYLTGKKEVINPEKNIIYTDIKNISRVLNDECYLYGKSLMGFDGEEKYNFEEGGLKRVYYYDSTYYVQSDTNFIYTLDENFNKISESVKCSSAPVEEIIYTDSGIIATFGENNTIKSYGIINKEDISIENYLQDYDDFKLDYEKTRESDGKYIYLYKSLDVQGFTKSYKIIDAKKMKEIIVFE